MPYTKTAHLPADREVLKLTQEEFQALPPALMLELAIGAGLTVLGACMEHGEMGSTVAMSSRRIHGSSP